METAFLKNESQGTRLEFIACPICDSTVHQELLFSEGYRIVHCSQCGLLFVNPRQTVGNLMVEYGNNYWSDNKDLENYTLGNYRDMEEVATKVRKLLPEKARLLEIGSAAGLFLSHFSSNPQWKVEGLEPSPLAVRYSRKKFGLTVYEGFLKGQNFRDDSYDVLTCLNTFHMLPTPNEDLTEMSRILKPKGLLILEIPGLTFRFFKNVGLVSKLLYGKSAHLNAGTHLFFYSPKTIRLLLEKHRFTIIQALSRSPVYPSLFLRILNSIFSTLVCFIYQASLGTINLAQKYFLVCRNDKQQ